RQSTGKTTADNTTTTTPSEPETGEEEGDEEETDEEPSNGKSKKKSKNPPKALKGLSGQMKGKPLLSAFKEIAKIVHQYVKEAGKITANYFVPLRSRSSGSGRKHGGASSTSTPNPFRFLAHWAVYWYCVVMIY